MSPPFCIDFSAQAPPCAQHLAEPPAFRLSAPDSGWIHLFIEDAAGTPLMPYVRMSDVFPPLTSLWLWSRGLALGLAPAAVTIDEEGCSVEFGAVPEAGRHMRFWLRRYREMEVFACVTWREDRTTFLARWSTLWHAYFTNPVTDWRQWEWGEDAWPEPGREMDWHGLADCQYTPPTHLPRTARIAWFWWHMADALRRKGLRFVHPEQTTRTARLAVCLTRQALLAAETAWHILIHDVEPPSRQPFERRAQRVAHIADLLYIPHDDPHADPFVTCASKPRDDAYCTRLLFRALYPAIDIASNEILKSMYRGLSEHLPIVPGPDVTDEQQSR